MSQNNFNVFFWACCTMGSSFTEIDQRKERMLEILEDRGLSFLFPLLRVQSELGRQIAAEPSANAIFKWIKERVDPQLFTNTKFINILMTRCVSQYLFNLRFLITALLTRASSSNHMNF